MASARTAERKAARARLAQKGAEVAATAGPRAVVEVSKLSEVSPAQEARRKRLREMTAAERKSIHRITMPPHPGARKPMQCRMVGCSERLSYRATSICCSELCENALRRMCETYLKILDGLMPAELLPYYYRVRGSARFQPLIDLDPTFRKAQLHAAKEAQDRRHRQDGHQRRWHTDVPKLRGTQEVDERVSGDAGGEVQVPDFSDRG